MLGFVLIIAVCFFALPALSNGLSDVNDLSVNDDRSAFRCDDRESGGCSCICSTDSQQSTQEFSYDCSGKADGNYPHPSKCTHFVSCVAKAYAYEMQCPYGPDGQPLHYVRYSSPDPPTTECDYPELAGCECPAGSSAGCLTKPDT